MITTGYELQLHPLRQYEEYKNHETHENVKKIATAYKKPRSPGDIFKPKKEVSNNQLQLHPFRQMEIIREKQMAIQLHPSKILNAETPKVSIINEPVMRPTIRMCERERKFRSFVIKDKFQTLD